MTPIVRQPAEAVQANWLCCFEWTCPVFAASLLYVITGFLLVAFAGALSVDATMESMEIVDDIDA